MNRKITASQLEDIKQAKADGMSTKELAELYGVSVTAINKRLRSSPQKTEPAGKSCPKCHRGGFPQEYIYCPYCQTDMRTARDKLLELVENTLRENPMMPRATAFCLEKVIAYLKEGDDVQPS